MPGNRYEADVLRAGWQQAHLKKSMPVAAALGMVLEVPSVDFVGAVVMLENGIVVLEDRRGKRRSFPLGGGFLLEGQPVILESARRKAPRASHTASGSRVGVVSAPKVALPSRIFVEGRHDAELVEKVWGDDLRHVGVVVEYLEGVDDLAAIVADFGPKPGHRLGVLVDHLVPGSKETRIAEAVARGPAGEHVLITGHRFIDIWAAVKPERVGLKRWPDIPRDIEWKAGICQALGWPARDQADIAAAWKRILKRVDNWNHLERDLLTSVERLIDFVTADALLIDEETP